MPWLAVLESEINPYLGISPSSSLEASRSYLLEQGLDPNRAKMWCVSHPCLPPRSLQEREEILSAILVPSLGRCPYGACFHLSENTTRSLRSKLGRAAVRLDFPALSAHGAGPFPVPTGTLLLTALVYQRGGPSAGTCTQLSISMYVRSCFLRTSGTLRRDRTPRSRLRPGVCDEGAEEQAHPSQVSALSAAHRTALRLHCRSEATSEWAWDRPPSSWTTRPCGIVRISVNTGSLKPRPLVRLSGTLSVCDWSLAAACLEMSCLCLLIKQRDNKGGHASPQCPGLALWGAPSASASPPGWPSSACLFIVRCPPRAAGPCDVVPACPHRNLPSPQVSF